MKANMQYTFVNDAHEKAYHAAMRLLASEDARQKQEHDRLPVEWDRLPENLRRERYVWLQQHFHACREPYVKLLTDIVSLARPIIFIPSPHGE